eukprot:NODE_29123_length_455_cov_7.289634.p1 GENE.NODE_29123_length_455_cov_7.289634~~NODE_29123_length_455_cov_7.289634.p1  ORF type:complete len:135 (-),score=46.41 NODE_29123_length_455_cov_7.289634:50-454(-)
MGGMGGMGAGAGGGAGGGERAFFAALRASGVGTAQLTLLLPQALVHDVFVPQGIMGDVAVRSGSKIDLGREGPSGTQQVVLNGSMVSNALASLYLQEKVVQAQHIMWKKKKKKKKKKPRRDCSLYTHDHAHKIE